MKLSINKLGKALFCTKMNTLNCPNEHTVSTVLSYFFTFRHLKFFICFKYSLKSSLTILKIQTPERLAWKHFLLNK